MNVDLDDTRVEVHGYSKAGRRVRILRGAGLNALLATASTAQVAPVIPAQRLRRGVDGLPAGAARLAADTPALIRRSHLAGRAVLVRADSAFCSLALVTTVLTAGADVSITVRMDAAAKRAPPRCRQPDGGREDVAHPVVPRMPAWRRRRVHAEGSHGTLVGP